MALDSTFSLPYVHRIEYAINTRDTAATSRMLDLFARFAPDSRHLFQLRLLAGMVLGDAGTRAAGAATLDTLPLDRQLWLGFQLAAASRWDLSEQVFRVARNRPQHPPVASHALFFTSLARGRIREARRWMADPYTLPSRKPRMIFTLSLIGVPASAADLDQLLPRGAADTLDAMQLFYLGAIAADQGRGPVGQEMLERLRARGRRTGTAEDSTEATLARALQQGLEGYQAWRGGQRDLALRLLQDAQRHAHGRQNINDMLRWLLGRLQAELGHPREALPYFESIAVTLPPTNYERGQVYEQLGMAAQAREAYSLFLTPRQQPDSLVQFQDQKSREALARLGAGAP